MVQRTYDCHYGCPVEATLDVIGGRWKGIILFHLLGGMRRYNEMRRLIPGVTQRVLTLQLRELEDAGIIDRRVFPEMPPRVEYRLSPFGASLEPIIRMMRDWGVAYMHRGARPKKPRPFSAISTAECGQPFDG